MENGGVPGGTDGGRVRVETPARLHFGFLDLSGGSGRLFSGVGVGIDRPRAVVEAEASDTVEVDGGEQFQGLAEAAVEALDAPGVRLNAVRSIPRHVGLGSGTQHASAVLEAVARVDGAEATREDARSLGRGIRSGVGRAVFEGGGFVVDSGHPPETPPEERGIPPVAVRHDLPSDWRFVVAVPEGSGAHGEEESQRMEGVVGNEEPGGIADEIRRVFLGSLLPGAADGDIEEFGAGIEALDGLNGEWYAALGGQGGTYHPAAEPLVDAFKRDDRVTGAGQSSWGPSVYALTTASEAEDVASSVDAETYVARPDPLGARTALTRRL